MDNSENRALDSKKLLMRLAISLLQKRKFLDRCFFKRNIYDFKLVQVESVVLLADLIWEWSKLYAQQPEKGDNDEDSAKKQVRTIHHSSFKDKSYANQFIILSNSLILNSAGKPPKPGQIVPQ